MFLQAREFFSKHDFLHVLFKYVSAILPAFYNQRPNTSRNLLLFIIQRRFFRCFVFVFPDEKSDFRVGIVSL
jgi:hypothetical protein